MKKVIIVTAEPENFVPVELKKAAEEQGLEARILDVSKCILVEELQGDSPESYELGSKVCVIEKDGEVEHVEVCSETGIIPRLNEYHLEIKLGILKRFEKLGAVLLNTAESMSLCNDKLMTQVMLNSAGIKTPYSVLIQNLDDIEKVVAHLEEQGKISYPFVIKTLRGTHGIGVMKVDSRSSLISVAQTLSKEGLDFMLQEFCKHDRSARIIMIGDKMLAANLRGQPKEKDEFRTNSHLGSETEKYEPSDEEIAVARRIVELFGSRFCAIDYLITETGKIIVLEVNGSPGLENIQKNWPDKNLAGEVIATFCNIPVPTTGRPSYGGKYANFHNQMASGVDDLAFKTDNLETDLAPEASEDTPSEIPDNTIGETEPVTIHRILQDSEARVDTGAKYCSLHVDNVSTEGNWVRFKRGDVTYKVPTHKSVKIRHASLGDSVSRPVVKLDITVRGQRLNQVEFTLNDRSSMKYQVLIGRNALSHLGLPVIVYKDPANQETAPESEIYDVEEE